MNQYYQYYVEGETEEKILEVLKTDFRCIMPGKVKVFNVIEEKFSRSKLISLKRKTNVVLVFDTDSSDSSTLRANISFLEEQSVVRQVICIPQVKNLEKELIRCCNIRKMKGIITPRASPGPRRRRLLCLSKGQGTDTYVACTRSGE